MIFRDEFFGRRAQLLSSLTRAIQRRVGKNHHEFLASETTDNVFAAKLRLQQMPQRAEDDVARFMAEGIVEAFEMIDIDQQQGNRRVFANGARQFAVERLFHVAAVVKIGQRIADRLRAERLAQLQVCEG